MDALELKIGQRVRLLRECGYWRYFMALPGATGTVLYERGYCVGVKMDEPIKGAEPWNNVIFWYNDGEPNNLDDIMNDLEVIE